MTTKIYSLILFVSLYWFVCLYIGFKTQKKIAVPVDYFIFGRQVPGWSYITIMTGTVFSGWIFFVQPSLIFINGSAQKISEHLGVVRRSFGGRLGSFGVRSGFVRAPFGFRSGQLRIKSFGTKSLEFQKLSICAAVAAAAGTL